MKCVDCYYWIGRVPDTSTTEYSTIVVLTNISVTKEDLKKNYKHTGIKLKRVDKKDTRLIYRHIVFVSRHTKKLIIPNISNTSSVLRTIISIYTKNDDLASAFERKCSITKNDDIASAFERKCSIL